MNEVLLVQLRRKTKSREYLLTVKRNGHLANVDAGVWRTGSSKEMNAWEDEMSRLIMYQGFDETYIDALIETKCMCQNCDQDGTAEEAHMSNNLSTSSGATKPCTSISGGLCCSMSIARIPRSEAGPGIK